MNLLDLLVLVGCMAGIAAYGVWQTRGRQGLSHYLKGDERTGWAVIGLSVMATQASAVTFLSMPGQGYQDGIGFVQNYFGAPLALILIAAVFLPMYRRLNVYTAYEFLGRRFDAKTRLLGRSPVPPSARPAGRDHRLRAGDHPLDRAALAHRRHHPADGDGGDRLHGGGRQPGGELDAKIPARRDLLWDAHRLRGADAPLAHRGGALGRPGLGRRIRQAEGGRLLGRPEPALHVLVGAARGLLPGAFLFRHRPVAGSALPLGGLASRKPDRAHVQRRAENPHAVLHPSARDDGVRLLPVRDTAVVLQPRRHGRAGSCETRAIG